VRGSVCSWKVRLLEVVFIEGGHNGRRRWEPEPGGEVCPQPSAQPHKSRRPPCQEFNRMVLIIPKELLESACRQ